MAFPNNPTNGQIYMNALGTQYKYNSSKNAWLISSAGATGIGQVVGLTSLYEIGDSMTDSGGNDTYQPYLLAKLGPTWKPGGGVNNKGEGATYTWQMVRKLTTDVLQQPDIDYAIVWGGVNDIGAGYTAAQIEANLQSMYTSLHNQGIKVIAINITPYNPSEGWDTTKQARSDAVNTWIASTATNIDYKVDACNAVKDSSDYTRLNTAYDSGDHLHLSAAGYSKVADTIFSAVTWAPDASIGLYNIYVSGKSVSLNQSLTVSDAPRFSNLTLRGSYLQNNTQASPATWTGGSLVADGTTLVGTDGTNWNVYSSLQGVGIGTTSPIVQLDICPSPSGYTVDNRTGGLLGIMLRDNAVRASVLSGFYIVPNGGFNYFFSAGGGMAGGAPLIIADYNAGNTAQFIDVANKKTFFGSLASPFCTVDITGAASYGPLRLYSQQSAPTAPQANDAVQIYVKNTGKLVLQYQDGATTRYKWLDMTGTNIAWQTSTSAP